MIERIDQLKQSSETYTGVLIKELPIGPSGVILINNLPFAAYMNLLRRATLADPIDVYPTKRSFRILAGNDGVVPNVIVSDSSLVTVDTSYDVEMQKFTYGKWEFKYPISYVSTISYATNSPEPVVTIQSILKQGEFLRRISEYISRDNLRVHHR